MSIAEPLAPPSAAETLGAVAAIRSTVALFHAPGGGLVARALDEAGDVVRARRAGESLAGILPPVYPEWLGSREFAVAHGVRCVGVAGYPVGHPRLYLDALDAALDRKIAQASGRGIELFVVTQFCFDGDAILAWLARLRARGVALPVRVGVAGPTRIRTLLAYAARCGIGDSIRALRAHAISLPHLLAEHRADEVVRRIAAGGPRPGVAGLHCFPFGGFAQAARWLGAAASGPLPRA